MKYFDTHAHLNYSPLLDKEKEIVQECADALLLINDVGTCANSSYVAVEQAKKYENVYATVGIHPCDVVEAASNDMERIEELLKDKQQNKIIAIGETGLDYYHKPFDAEVQKAFLLKHIALAIKYDLPLVMHIRDAHDDAYEILTKNIPHNINVIIHCFDSTPEFAKKYTDAGYWLAFGGKITWEGKESRLHNALKSTPINKVILETDAPWLTPTSHKPDSNKPIYVLDTLAECAATLNIEKDEFAKQVYENSLNAFKLKCKI